MAAVDDNGSPDLEHFRGEKWTDWLEAIQSSEYEQALIPDYVSNRNVEVAILDQSDMPLFGYRPANDKFYLVACEHCGDLVKPQSLCIHYERRHGNVELPKVPSMSFSKTSFGFRKFDVNNSKHILSSSVLKNVGTMLCNKNVKVSEGSKACRSELSDAKALSHCVRRSEGLIANELSPLKNCLGQPGQKRTVNKPGKALQLQEVPDSHVVKTIHPETALKHNKLGKQLNRSVNERDLPLSASQKKHDAIHQRQGIPLIVLQKTLVPPAIGTVKVAHSRKRPLSCDSDSSMASFQSKIAALHLNKKGKEKILPLKDREYDPNKHCGVWIQDKNVHCRRSLTCKNHTLNAKRQVAGRLKSYDEMVRDKQKLKEAMAAPKVVASMHPPSVSSPEDLPMPSPVSISGPLVLNVSVSSTNLTPTSPMLVSRAKSMISLFPRIYAAWHVDCWDDDEVIEDCPMKHSEFLHYTQHNPLPIVVQDLHARLTSASQISYHRQPERQLEAITSVFEDFLKQHQNCTKAFSFTPIAGANSCFKSLGDAEYNQNSALDVSGGKTLKSLSCNGNSSSLSLKDRVKEPCASKLAHYSTPLNSDSISNSLICKAMVKKSCSDWNRTYSFSVSSTSSKISLAKQNSVRQVNSKIPSKIEFNPQNDVKDMFSNNHTCEDSLDVRIPSTSTVIISSTNSYAGGLTSGSLDHDNNAKRVYAGSSLALHMRNNINSISRRKLNSRSHSVTLSGNIGALTSSSEDSHYIGNQLQGTMKNMNSNNNFTMPNDSHLLASKGMRGNPKKLDSLSGSSPAAKEVSPTHARNILQYDEQLLSPRNLSNMNPSSQCHFHTLVDDLLMDSPNHVIADTVSSTDALMELIYDSSGSSKISPNSALHKVPDLAEIDASMLEQVLATSSSSD